MAISTVLIEKIQRFKDAKSSGLFLREQEGVSVTIPIDSYSELSEMLQSLLSVCQTASEYVNEDFETASEYDIFNVLKLTKSFIPVEELQFLDEIINS